jgi:large subunit ribosomal protein L35
MSKMKTNRSAKKRFKVTGSGKLMRNQRNLNHLLEKKSSRRKRRLTGANEVSSADGGTIKRLLAR